MNEEYNTQLEQESGVTGSIGRYPIGFAMLAGAVASLPLPIAVLAWKIDLCNYGLGNDYSGICICLPVSFGVGVGLAAIAGAMGKLVGKTLAERTQTGRPYLIGSLVGGVVGGLLGLLVSAIPAFIFAFPDC